MKTIIKNTTIKKTVIISLIITLMSTYFVIVGQTMSIALSVGIESQGEDTNANNVKFDVYFNSEESKEHEKSANLAEEQTLILNVNVKNQGVLKDAKISIENPNFTIIKGKMTSEYVKKIDTDKNEIELNSIIYSNNAIIELPIKLKKLNNFTEDYFEKEINVNLTGTYNNEIDTNVEAQRKIKLNWTADTEVSFTQEVGKFIKLGEKEILVQQNINTEVPNNILPRKQETINIKAQQISGKYPQEVTVLANGVKLDADKIKYNSEDGSLEIVNSNELNENNEVSWGNAVNEYNVIYTYNEVETVNATVNLYTTVSTQLYTKADAIVKSENVEVQVQEKGNIVEVTKDATDSLYKGYMYANPENETIFEENNTIKISKATQVATIELTNQEETFSDEKGRKYNAVTIYKATTFDKAELERIFGESYEIKILDKQNNEIAKITNETESDEAGNITVNYNEPTDYIKVVTSKPQTEGNFVIKNTKAIKGNANYKKAQLKSFTKLNLNGTLTNGDKQSTSSAEIVLNDTKTEAKLEISNTNLSTLQVNKDVQFVLTLKSDDAQYDLYKNPKIQIVLPQELDIDVKKSAQLNFEDEIKISKIGLQNRKDGRKEIILELSGEQKNFASNLAQGIQIAIIADITIANTVPTKDEKIELLYTNENRPTEALTGEVPIKINSKHGVLMTNKLENYSNSGETIETNDDKVVMAKLDTNEEAKLAKRTINVINNYEEPIKDVSILGKIGDEEEIDSQTFKTTIEANLQNVIAAQNKKASIYFTDRSDLEAQSEQWKSTTEELNTVKAFKVVLEDELQPKESFSTEYNLYIPENVESGESLYTKTQLQYNYQDSEETTISAMGLSAEESEQEQPSGITQDVNGISVEIQAKSGDKTLKENDTVIEGQAIKYVLKLTNNTGKDIKNMTLEATNTNAIYYGEVEHEEEVFGQMQKRYEYMEDNTLNSKQIKIEELKAGETKEVDYQVGVKEVADNNQTITGQIKMTAEGMEEKTIQNITNKINKGKLKLTLADTTSLDISLNGDDAYPLEFKVENISKEEVRDVIVEIPVSENLNFSTANAYVENGEFLEYKDGIAKFKINQIAEGQTETIYVRFYIKTIPNTELGMMISQYFNVNYEDINYTSNYQEREAKQNKVEIVGIQNTNIQESTVRDGDNIIITIDIENKGIIDARINISDVIPEGLKINNIKTIQNGKEIPAENDRIFSTTIDIKPKEKIQIIIDTTLDSSVVEGNKIINTVNINGYGVTANINTLELIIDGKEPVNPDDPTEKELKNISGRAWIDENKNGNRDAQEKGLPNTTVMLLDEKTQNIAKDKNGNELITTTDENGMYEFKEIEKGKYSVIFIYDSKNYYITEYQKEGVAESQNSDVVSATITLKNEKIKCAKTKELNLSNTNLANIDAGFIKSEIFDLKLEKYINKITVQNSDGTRVISYNKEKLAKVEIDAKKIANSKVTIEYSIEITNEGDVAGYANEIVDYLPNDLKFSNQSNSGWKQNTNGNLYTTALANQVILPGQTKTINLTLTKDMTQDNTGRILNKAEINKHYNERMLDDIDSTPGNKDEKEDDMSNADVIISIKTGSIILYTTITIISIAILATGIYFIKKKVLG